jgi:uncharacterized protein (TIGR03905 family)
MKTFEYTPSGVCSTKMIFEIDNNIIHSLKVINGCDGNLKGIGRLITGMNIDDVISKLEGTTCRMKNTSCPDQIAQALKEYKKINSGE